MSKKIIGLDLGTTSIGWAFVREAERENELSSIDKIGVRIIQYDTFSKVDKSGKVTESKNPEQEFAAGKGLSPNADRTLKRGVRRNLQRYKQRRKNLIAALINGGIINKDAILAETDKQSTHSTYQLRSKAATEKIALEAFARILLMLNKKRGYKSSRKAKNEDEGKAIDGMAIAKRLYEENLTPGQLCYQLLQGGKKQLPEFYRSDLQAEFHNVWNFQKQFYPEILSDKIKEELIGKNRTQTWAICREPFEIVGIKREKKGIDLKTENYEWREKALTKQLNLEQLAIVLQEINGSLSASSGYLGDISDRSKELYFNKLTVGQYLYRQLENNPNTRMKKQVFYRQDYFDEFETIWQTQAKYYAELTPALKQEIRDIVIFYQRKLKSQKGLVSFCEFESKTIEIIEGGKSKTKTIGHKVAPKSSLLFQEFKIWQNLNNLLIQNKKTKEIASFNLEAKQLLFNELNIKGNLSSEDALKTVGYTSKEWGLNFKVLEGNRTNQALHAAYFKMMELEGTEEVEWLTLPIEAIKKRTQHFFESQNIDSTILSFNADLDGKAFELQPAYQLWHLLYSYEGDNSPSGNEELYRLLSKKFGFKKEHGQILANVAFSDDYGSLSAKAMRKILVFLKAGHPFAKKDKEEEVASATALAGYNHSSSITAEENENRVLKDKLELLPKNSLRNPVVEKILNQMVNVINAIIADPALGKPDEIRIELSRELKKNAKEREEMTKSIETATKEHDRIRELLIKEDGIKNPTRNDIIRYKLYQELRINGYKTLYSNTYIPREKLFSKEFDIEHIIPKALLFDDSFSNKTLCVRKENLDKGNVCARDFIGPYFGEGKVADYLGRVEMMGKAKEGAISKAKYKKLLMSASDIGEGFIERDLRETQYIARKAKQMLHEICRTVVSTSGSITDKLREDWDLINVMQELNFEKYKQLGLTELVEKKDGGVKERIKDWSKRNDHRHHAMDALTVAFTQHNHIQYLNNLNARRNEQNKKHAIIAAIENKITALITDPDDGQRKRKFKLPIPHFRSEAKKHLEEVLVSFKAKNKVATKNKNKYTTNKGEKVKVQITPRGQLHKETVYGKLRQYATKEEKIGPKFDAAMIAKVASEKQRIALFQRLTANDNDPKKAFTGKNSLDKFPIYLDAAKTILIPERIKMVRLEDDYSIRKDISPDIKIEKVIDVGVRRVLEARLAEYKGNAKEAFANLDKNPIWLNKEKGICVKRVTISGVKNAEALHYKKDHLGNEILDEIGKKIPVDFVSTGNNHHVAIYKDEEGNLQEKVISFYEAVERVNQGLPVVDKRFNQELGWQFVFTMKQNEYFIFPAKEFEPHEIDLFNTKNNTLISQNLFRVQKLATKNYMFRHHLETTVEEVKELVNKAYINLRNTNAVKDIIKVKINHIGQIVKLGEY